MQPTRPNRRRAAAAAPAAPVAGPAVPTLPVLEFHAPNGLLVIKDVRELVQVIENEQRLRLAAEAEQAALRVLYRLGGKPDESRPCGGLLTRRLDISESSARALITEGRLRYTCTGGSKGYRVSERAVREYLGDMPPN